MRIITNYFHLIMLCIVAALAFGLTGASLAMIGLAHMTIKQGLAVALFSLFTGWLTVNEIIDSIFYGSDENVR